MTKKQIDGWVRKLECRKKSLEKERDKLTKREPEEVQEEAAEDSVSGISLSSLIGGFVVFFIGVSLIEPVKEQVDLVGSNVTGASYTLLNLVPIIFSLVVLGVTIAILTNCLRNTGLI